MCSINHVQQGARDWFLIPAHNIETLTDVNKCQES